MTRYLIFACSILAAIAVAGGFLLQGPGSSKAGAHRHAAPPQPEETEEDPGARERMEWMQLRDPATGRIPDNIRRGELAFAATLPKHDRGTLAKRAGAALDWHRRGPYNVGGRTRAFAIDASNSSTMLAGGITGGVWRSENSGQRWSATTAPDQIPSVTCIAQDTRAGKRGTWYYGTGEFRSNSTRFGGAQWPGNGIFKSVDGGRTWTPLASTTGTTPQTLDSPFEYVNGIVIDTSNHAGDEIYAACYGAIMRSTNGGTSWRAVLGGPGNNVGYTTIAITPTGTLYAGFGSGGTVRGIWRSADGITWYNISPVGWSDSCRRITLAIVPSDPGRMYVLAQTPSDGLTVPGSYGYPEKYSFWAYEYVDGDGTGAGGNWDYRTFNLPQSGGLWTYNGLDSYTMHVTVSPTDPETVYLGGTNLYVSIDGFSTTAGSRWLGGYQENGNWGGDAALHPDQHSLAFRPGFKVAYATTDGGIFTTDQLESQFPEWASLNNGYFTTQFYSIAIDPATPGSQTIMGGLQDNGTVMSFTDDEQDSWQMPYGGDGCMCAIAGGGQTMYVSSQNGNLYRLHFQDGLSYPSEWVHIQPTDATGFLFLAPFALDLTSQSVLFLAAGNSLWRNSNTEEIPFDSTYQPTMVNWEKLAATESARTISAVASTTDSPRHRIYYGTADGHVLMLDEANTGMPAPVDITGTNFPAGAYVNCIAVDPLNGNHALAVFTNYNVQSLFYTTDAGGTWTAVAGNLEEHIDGTGNGPSCRWAAIVHRGNEVSAFVGTTTGLYSTTRLDGSATMWSQEAPSTIGYARVDMIAARASDGMVAVGTWGKGAYSTMLAPLGVEDDAIAGAPDMLEMNAPNPVRTTTTIGYTVPERASMHRVKLAVYDMQGREVAMLVDAALPAGRHTTVLDAASLAGGALANGSYYYRIECDGRGQTRRLVVTK